MSIPGRSLESLSLQLPPLQPTSVTVLPTDVSFPGRSHAISKPVDLFHTRLHSRANTSPHLGGWTPLDLPAGNFLLCCKDLLQMLMLSFRWRALWLICHNTFHTLLLKLCPLLFPAFKLKRSPACRRRAGFVACWLRPAPGAAERRVKRCPSEHLLAGGSQGREQESWEGWEVQNQGAVGSAWTH